MKKIIITVLLFSSISMFAQKIEPKVKTGLEVLESKKFDILKNKRVGLITNPTGVNSQLKSTVDIFYESKAVNLVALFGPEHGVRGNFTAGAHIGTESDAKTGLPVFSLYGKNRKPSAEMLKGIDVLVYDIQDVGSRSYTYISTLGLAMEAAAENNIEVVVLDRPNPLGGERFEGALVEDGYFSFVSQYAVPYVYGLTPGEFAIYINENGMLSNGLKCKLQVVKMENWQRSMTFEETGLPWVPTSPHIPRANSSEYYAMSGILGELDGSMIGVGYTLPFEVFATDWLDGEILAKEMNNLQLEGVLFRPIHFKPYYSEKKGKEFSGVQVYFTDKKKVKLTEIQFRFAEIAHKLNPDTSVFDNSEKRFDMFDKVCGTNKIRETFLKNHKFSDIEELWNKDAIIFKEKAKKYFLY
jgi:uncharacterized protein YbbC (DUF1343 family)